jgi:hypothetical protein
MDIIMRVDNNFLTNPVSSEVQNEYFLASEREVVVKMRNGCDVLLFGLSVPGQVRPGESFSVSVKYQLDPHCGYGAFGPGGTFLIFGLAGVGAEYISRKPGENLRNNQYEGTLNFSLVAPENLGNYEIRVQVSLFGDDLMYWAKKEWWGLREPDASRTLGIVHVAY